MNSYEQMLCKVESENLLIKEKPLLSSNGRIKGKRIAIKIDTPNVVKYCALAEELGHYYTTVGDIRNQKYSDNRKQELQARKWAHNELIGLDGIVNAFEHKCSSRSEVAEFLDVTEEFLQEAIECYRQKYGVCAEYKGYLIMFIPNLCVGRII